MKAGGKKEFLPIGGVKVLVTGKNKEESGEEAAEEGGLVCWLGIKRDKR